MVSADPYVIEFVGGNALSIGLLLLLLKGVAKLTKNVHDDKVVTLLQTLFGQVPKAEKPAEPKT